MFVLPAIRSGPSSVGGRQGRGAGHCSSAPPAPPAWPLPPRIHSGFAPAFTVLIYCYARRRAGGVCGVEEERRMFVLPAIRSGPSSAGGRQGLGAPAAARRPFRLRPPAPWLHGPGPGLPSPALY